MSWYLVVLEGGPIEAPAHFQITGKPSRALGFVTTRKASAETKSEAINLAIKDALKELRGSLLTKDAAVPEFKVSDVRRLNWLRAAGRRYSGFTFYPWPTVH